MADARANMSKVDLSGAPRWASPIGLRLLAVGTRHDLPGTTFGPRRQFSWELVWVRQGSVRVRIDDREYAVAENGVLLVPPGVVDQYDWDTERRCSHSFIHFDFARLGKGWPDLADWRRLVELPPNHLVHQLIDQTTSLPVNQPQQWTVLGVPMLELVLRLLVIGRDLSQSPQLGLPKCVDRSLEWLRLRIDERPERRMHLNDIARAARVDPTYLCHVFRKYLGMGPMHCARLMRLDRAVSLLERGDDSIKEIAHACGFSDGFHFSKAFRLVFDCAPSKYREDFRRGKVRRLVTPAFERLAAQYIVWCAPQSDT